MTDLREATESQLLDALRTAGRAAGRLTRGKATEMRHVLLYASQDMMQLRDYVVTEQMRWTTAAAALEDVIGRLEVLRAYIVPGSRVVILNRNEIGGTSAPPAGTVQAEIRTLRAEP